MLNIKHYENSMGDGIPVLQSEVDGKEVFVPLKKTELTGDVHGPLARFCLTQIFSYSKAQLDKIIEAKYRFPLPGDAAVIGVNISFGKVQIAAELKEKEKAKKEYEQAKADGKQAAMTVRESIDVFTLHVAGIKPDEEVKVETTYVQMAKADYEKWTLRVPLTTAPRYYSAAASGSSDANPLAVLRDPKHNFSAFLTFHGANEIFSPSHNLKIDKTTKHKTTIWLGETKADQDFVLNWAATRSAKEAMQVFTHDEADYTYFMALITPPGDKNNRNIMSRETVILLDHSGSMSGAKSEAGFWTVRQYLNRMNERDLFSFALFHDKPVWHNDELLPATKENVDSVDRFLRMGHQMGGTELVPALKAALAVSKSPEERSRHVLIITDAQISQQDGDNCIAMALKEISLKDRRRISVICIDAAPNSQLVDSLAEAGGGESKYLNGNPASAECDISSTLDNILTQWEDPIATNLVLKINRPGVQSVGKMNRELDNRYSQIDIGDLPAERPLWVCGRVPRANEPLGFKLESDKGVAQVSAAKEYSFCPAAKALFGAKRIQELEFYSSFELKKKNEALKMMGYDPSDVKDYKALIAKESLAFGIPSSETSFVAVRKNSDAKTEETIDVPNALPANWNSTCSLQSLGGTYPSAAYVVSPQYTLPGGIGSNVRGLTKSSSMKFLRSADNSFSNRCSDTFESLKDKLSADFKLTRGLTDNTQQKQLLMNFGGGDSGAGAAYCSGDSVPISITPGEFIMSKSTIGPVKIGGFTVMGTADVANQIAALYTGNPKDGEVLYSSVFSAMFSKIRVKFLSDDDEDFDNAFILVYVGDMSVPKARIRLKDFVKYSERPLSLKCNNETVKIVMAGTILSKFELFLL